MILHLVYTCYHLLSHRLLVLHPNEHVGNLDLLQELFLRILHDSWTVCTAKRGKGINVTRSDRFTQLARPGRRTFDQGLCCRRCDS